MIVAIAPRKLPNMADNRLYLDYLEGRDAAMRFFPRPPQDLAGSLEARTGYPYPRQEVSAVLAPYNRELGAHARAMANVASLADPGTFCVIGGQQAGFMGGPAYTAYKIVTAIRLAEYLQETFGGRFVPMFWLATEDHDLNEVNHTYFLKADGEVGRVRFGWDLEGHPIGDLTVTLGVERAYEDYLENLGEGPGWSMVQECFAPRPGEGFGVWQGRIWSGLFSARGLVVLEPEVLRPLAGQWFRFALEHADEVARRLELVSQQLGAEGYTPALASDQAGRLYTFDPAGYRVRVDDPGQHLEQVVLHPERYSTDAALRPLFADTMLPVVASALGPGEVAYQAMLRPLYELFGLPQPLLFPRKTYTVLAQSEAERLAQYGASPELVLREQLDLDAAFRDLVPAAEREMFALARRAVEQALFPLRAYLQGVDPSLDRTWEQTVTGSVRSLETLQQRAFKARMSQLRFSKGELRGLQNALLPRGRLQERVFPLPHFLNRYGSGFIDSLFSAGELGDFRHHVLTVEGGHA